MRHSCHLFEIVCSSIAFQLWWSPILTYVTKLVFWAAQNYTIAEFPWLWCLQLSIVMHSFSPTQTVFYLTAQLLWLNEETLFEQTGFYPSATPLWKQNLAIQEMCIWLAISYPKTLAPIQFISPLSNWHPDLYWCWNRAELLWTGQTANIALYLPRDARRHLWNRAQSCGNWKLFQVIWKSA